MRFSPSLFREFLRERQASVSTHRACLLEQGSPLATKLKAQESVLNDWLAEAAQNPTKSQALRLLGKHLGDADVGALAAEVRTAIGQGMRLRGVGGPDAMSIEAAKARIEALEAIAPGSMSGAGELIDRCAQNGLKLVSFTVVKDLAERKRRGFTGT